MVGYEGFYEVSDHGRVRSLDRVVQQRGRKARRFPGVVLSTSKRHPFGYVAFNLSRNNSTRTFAAHDIVLTAFVGPRPEGFYGLHGDDDPSNNCLSNLRWGTPADNSRDMVSRGRRFDPYAGRTTCGRNHKLISPNLRGHYCLACYRTQVFRSNAKRDGRHVPDFQQYSDAWYMSIMSSG